MQPGFEQYADEIRRGLMEDTQGQTQPTQDTKPTLETITAVDLQRKDIPPLQFVVDGLIPHGLTILASPPKYGKSWMVLDLCLSVAAGRQFLGHRTNQTGCLYLALEDSQRRLKQRMNLVLGGGQAPGGFAFATDAHDLDNGLLDELGGYIKGNPQTGLIVIDTLQRVRGAVHGRENSYSNDYREIGLLKRFADTHNVALVLVHHLRKMKDKGDVFDRISGTNGIMGAADTTLVLTKEKRSDENATLSIVGRDVESNEVVLRFSKDAFKWSNLGNADWFEEQQAQQDYQDSPIVKTVRKLVEQAPDHQWEGTAKDLMEAGRYIARTSLAVSPRALSKELKALDPLLLSIDSIVHERKSNGSGGGKHRIYYVNTPPANDAPEENDPFFPF